MIVELARRVSSCGWVALCERRRAGFARLSGWQPVGNWVASGANFPASLLPVGVIPTTSRESRRTVCVGKWPRSQAERDPAYHRKAETIPRGGVVFYRVLQGSRLWAWEGVEMVRFLQSACFQG